MISRRPFYVAPVLLAVLVCRLDAKDYEHVKFQKAKKGALEFIDKKKKEIALPISLSLKVFDDQGTAFDPIEGMKFLVPGNVIDVKTDTDPATGKESIVEVRYVSGKVAKSGSSKVVDLKPSPDFKGNVVDVNLPDGELGRYYQSAHIGDFVEYKDHLGEGLRDEILEVGDDFVVNARVTSLLGSRTELRTRVKLKPAEWTIRAPNPTEPSKPDKTNSKPSKKAAKGDSKNSKTAKNPTKDPAAPPDEASETEELTVGERTLVCRIKKEGKSTKWFSPEVPFDGLVKVDAPHHKSQLVDFKRGGAAQQAR